MKIFLFFLLFLFSPILIAAQLDSMVTDLAVGCKGKVVAVLEFSDNKDSQQDSSIVQEKITTILIKKKLCRVVERKLLNKVLEELKLESSGIMDETTIKKVGKILGTDVLLMGTINSIKDNSLLEVNARLVNTETAEILGAETVEIYRTWKEAVAYDQPASSGPQKWEHPTVAYANKRMGEMRKENKLSPDEMVKQVLKELDMKGIQTLYSSGISTQ